MADVRFYFDLGSPYAYLAAERLETVIPAPVTWQPVLLGGLFRLNGRSSWAVGDRERRQRGIAIVEQRAQSYGLPPLRWPDDKWPGDYLFAMRATTFAYEIGRGREFTIEGYRAAFQRGIDLSVPDAVLEVGRKAGIDPAQLEAGASAPRTKEALRAVTDRAHALGVFGVPTLAVDQALFWGDDRLEDAAAHLRAASTA